MALKTHGTMAVDWEQRIDFDRLRRERLAKAKALLAKSEMGALLWFRHEQCALPDLDAHWHVGPRQGPTDLPCCRRTASPFFGISDRLPTSSIELPVARRALASWNFYAARRDDSRDGTRRRRRKKDSQLSSKCAGLHKEPVGIDIIELPVLFCAAARGHHGGRWSAADVQCPSD